MSLGLVEKTASPTVTKLGGQIGAEIRGITLSPDLDEASIAFIYNAMLEHKVIFFRKQSLTSAQQEDLGARFGTLVSHPTVSSAQGTKHIFELKSRKGRAANTWHADMTFMASYPKASILRCIRPAPYGGSTLWANTATAYRSLPQPLQELADKLWAIHTNNEYDHTDLIAERDWEFIQWQANVFAARVFEAKHPVVRVHPETGEKVLLLGQFIKRLVGFNLPDSQALLGILQGHVTRPENTITWHWQAGDVAMWDNRATEHRAIADFGQEERELQRVTLVGDAPRSVDGQQSEQVVNGTPNPVLLLEQTGAWSRREQS
ncbi:MAG: TauD/TfdA family dioxygenase [Acetobacter fabarum]|jgi:taurine dioxygenase|uniref:TauD/TfdA dioxygenase family protein n=1 Tax=Acetobacter fabarum TaxID=483199 RepID=UPI002432C6C3|nr:TauD/TfdA family dioxygenase [Acetobacter fabarum]MCH4024990.1 TauD/TfdA family dioxygenase [Acetobacter fabarum]MCH4128570.1 TauD/TfdA family dioxygenase [Acetobacter fabarum]MCH4141781.1 TauD/TfdA family dioxygenase [Acetobacter fabarum]MCI1297656.1 TauD/TfdA family dioxygenase [Acetobacter fabarum]MCI1323540.1 TauD/TfdA family dioxygenase [Acetobacter fabarum]